MSRAFCLGIDQAAGPHEAIAHVQSDNTQPRAIASHGKSRGPTLSAESFAIHIEQLHMGHLIGREIGVELNPHSSCPSEKVKEKGQAPAWLSAGSTSNEMSDHNHW